MDPPADTAKSSRRLCAVLMADVTGYSRLMGENEPATIAAVTELHGVLETIVSAYGGALEVFVGDCFVALFGSAVEAVQAARDVQTRLAGAVESGRKVRIRIGIHLGEVARTPDARLFGESINIAARIQELAPPGGVMVSDDVYRAVRNTLATPMRNAGRRKLKNIRSPIRVYYLGPEAASGEKGRATIHPSRLWPRLAPLRSARVLRWTAAVLLLSSGLYVIFGLRPHPPFGPQLTAFGSPTVVGVMEFRRRGAAPVWMRDLTRDGINTVLSKVKRLRVYSKQKIDFLAEKRRLPEIEVAEVLGITKMISGAVAMGESLVTIEWQIVDTSSGILDAAEEVRGRKDDLIELQNNVARQLLRALNVSVTPEEIDVILSNRTNETLNSYRLLTETFGDDIDESERLSSAAQRPTWALAWPAVAYAQEGEAIVQLRPAVAQEGKPAPAAEEDEHAVRDVLEAYRVALENKDMGQLSDVLVEVSEKQEEAFTRYFNHAQGLKVIFSDFDILVEGDEALASFTREDRFMDEHAGRELHLEVRVTGLLVKQDGQWKIRGLQRPS